jgi:hypothetical protein
MAPLEFSLQEAMRRRVVGQGCSAITAGCLKIALGMTIASPMFGRLRKG